MLLLKREFMDLGHVVIASACVAVLAVDEYAAPWVSRKADRFIIPDDRLGAGPRDLLRGFLLPEVRRIGSLLLRPLVISALSAGALPFYSSTTGQVFPSQRSVGAAAVFIAFFTAALVSLAVDTHLVCGPREILRPLGVAAVNAGIALVSIIYTGPAGQYCSLWEVLVALWPPLPQDGTPVLTAASAIVAWGLGLTAALIGAGVGAMLPYLVWQRAHACFRGAPPLLHHSSVVAVVGATVLAATWAGAQGSFIALALAQQRHGICVSSADALAAQSAIPEWGLLASSSAILLCLIGRVVAAGRNIQRRVNAIIANPDVQLGSVVSNLKENRQAPAHAVALDAAARQVQSSGREALAQLRRVITTHVVGAAPVGDDQMLQAVDLCVATTTAVIATSDSIQAIRAALRSRSIAWTSSFEVVGDGDPRHALWLTRTYLRAVRYVDRSWCGIPLPRRLWRRCPLASVAFASHHWDARKGMKQRHCVTARVYTGLLIRSLLRAEEIAGISGAGGPSLARVWRDLLMHADPETHDGGFCVRASSLEQALAALRDAEAERRGVGRPESKACDAGKKAAELDVPDDDDSVGAEDAASDPVDDDEGGAAAESGSDGLLVGSHFEGAAAGAGVVSAGSWMLWTWLGRGSGGQRPHGGPLRWLGPWVATAAQILGGRGGDARQRDRRHRRLCCCRCHWRPRAEPSLVDFEIVVRHPPCRCSPTLPKCDDCPRGARPGSGPSPFAVRISLLLGTHGDAGGETAAPALVSVLWKAIRVMDAVAAQVRDEAMADIGKTFPPAVAGALAQLRGAASALDRPVGTLAPPAIKGEHAALCASLHTIEAGCALLSPVSRALEGLWRAEEGAAAAAGAAAAPGPPPTAAAAEAGDLGTGRQLLQWVQDTRAGLERHAASLIAWPVVAVQLLQVGLGGGVACDGPPVAVETPARPAVAPAGGGDSEGGAAAAVPWLRRSLSALRAELWRLATESPPPLHQPAAAPTRRRIEASVLGYAAAHLLRELSRTRALGR